MGIPGVIRTTKDAEGWGFVAPTNGYGSGAGMLYDFPWKAISRGDAEGPLYWYGYDDVDLEDLHDAAENGWRR